VNLSVFKGITTAKRKEEKKESRKAEKKDSKKVNGPKILNTPETRIVRIGGIEDLCLKAPYTMNAKKKSQY